MLLGCINTALAYYKLCDDKADGDSKGVFRHFFKRGLLRAAKKHPQAVGIIKAQLEKQSELERRGCAVIDEACEPTAEMMQKLSVYALKEFSTAETQALFYDLGKWIYLADALDDYDKDVKKHRYNVLYNAFGEKCKADAVAKNTEEITYIFDSLFADMRKNLANIKFRYNRDLTDNIILRGIPLKTRSLLKCDCRKKQGK